MPISQMKRVIIDKLCVVNKAISKCDDQEERQRYELFRQDFLGTLKVLNQKRWES